MGDVIYVSANSFKTTQADALERLGDPGVFIQLRSDPVVATASIWDVYSSTFADIHAPSDWSAITGAAGVTLTPQEAWDAYKVSEELSVVSLGGGLVEFVKLVRVVSATAITGFTLAVISGQMSHAWASWSGGTVNNNEIPGTGTTGDGSQTITLDTGGDGDILGTGLLLQNIYFQAEDPTQLLVKVFDTEGNLITSGYPNVSGYFDPKFVDTEWTHLTFSSDGVPVDQLVSHASLDRTDWPPPDALHLLDAYSGDVAGYEWPVDSPCYSDPDDPTNEEESSSSGDGSTFAEAIEAVQDGGTTTPVDATGYGNTLELGEPGYYCDGGDSDHKVWFYTDFDGSGIGLHAYVYDSDDNILNIEVFIDLDGTVGGLESTGVADCSGNTWGVSASWESASAGRYYIRATAATSGSIANVGCIVETLDGGGGGE